MRYTDSKYSRRGRYRWEKASQDRGVRVVDGGQLRPGVLKVDHSGQCVVVQFVGAGRRREGIAAGLCCGRNVAPNLGLNKP